MKLLARSLLLVTVLSVVNANAQTYYLESLGGVSSRIPYPMDPYAGAEPIETVDASRHIYLIEDVSGGGMHAMDDSESLNPDDSGGGGGMNEFSDFTPQVIDTNGLWLQISNVFDGQAYVNLCHATDFVYEIFSRESLTDTNGWQIETELFPGTETNVLPFNLSLATHPSSLFLWARDWTGITSNGNTVPEWWFWLFYGTVNLSDDMLDGQNHSLLYDYTNGLAPANDIQFSLQFTNYEVSTSPVNGTINIQDGMPFYAAILVNDTNFAADAVWQPLASTNFTVNLDSGDGLYTVYVGLRGFPTNAVPVWAQVQLTLNTVAPTFIITNPISGVVSQPMIQLQGLVSETLSRLTFDVSNAAGVFTNQQGYWQPEFYDTNLLDFTTNTFECYDVKLTNGLNTITLHAMNVTGNTATTNVSLMLDYSSDTNPPALSIVWPQDGTLISGSNFTLQAHVDDDTATVIASINGQTNAGLVERNGTVWVNDLPMSAGTNILTVSATDAAGNSMTTNLTLIQSTVTVTMDPLSDDQLNQTNVKVYGIVSDPDDIVTVNDVAANVDPDTGDWEADGVPVSPTGTAGLNVQVSDSDDNSLTSQMLNQPQPAVVEVLSYQDAGSYAGSLIVPDGCGNSTSSSSSYSVDWVLGVGDWADGQSLTWQTSSFNEADSWSENGDCSLGQLVHTDSSSSQTQTRVVIAPSGPAVPGQTALYLVMAQVISEDTGLQLPGSAVQIQEQPLMDVTFGDGSVWSEALVSASSGVTPEITPKAQGNISYNGMLTTNLTMQLVVISGATQINGTTNWATVKGSSSDYVIIQAVLDITNAGSLALVGNSIHWSGGESVPGNPLQREVSKGTSAETTVTATLGGNSQSVNVWVVWADLTVKVSGTLDPDDKADVLEDDNWPILLGGGNSLGTLDTLSNSNLIYAYTIGKIEAKAILQPTGIGSIVTNGWNMQRTREIIAWDNGGNYNSGVWTSGPSASNPPPGVGDATNVVNKYLNPQNGDIFGLDAPGCSEHLTGTIIFHTSECYDNFYQYVTVNFGNGDQVCSDTNTWSYEAQVDVDATNQIQLNSLSTSLIALPTSPRYTYR